MFILENGLVLFVANIMTEMKMQRRIFTLNRKGFHLKKQCENIIACFGAMADVLAFAEINVMFC